MITYTIFGFLEACGLHALIRNQRALKNHHTLSRLHRFQKMITQISMIFQCFSHLCNRFIIGVIRDFWALSEISIKMLDRK
jgi:hypothetical protein